ncbi:MAG: chitobiase/beta-hexosaminidase C-terminal domain-containing protein, partial [Desulfuromonadales bacterium]|nr:chitobiase/beta-hexosaminidase C-terminal domain-containing protein [Desulfuromonadales bacterium]
ESFVITNQTFAPAFDTAPGIYFVPQQVGISSDSVGATIYYTTDGSPASAASLLYQAPIDISSTQTIRALAVKAGIADSVEVSNTYTIGNLSGTWSLMMITGENGCGQTVGQETSLGSVEIDHVGTMVTLASAFGSKTVEIGAGDLVWSTSFPVEQGVLDVDLTLNLVGEGDSFTGSVDFSFSGGIIACSGVGTLYGGKVE